MTLVACPIPGKGKSKFICEAFIAGAPRSAEGFVFYGVNDSNVGQWVKALRLGRAFYCDNSYFDNVRGAQFRVTKNAFQVRGAAGRVSDGKRFASLDLEIKPVQHNVVGHWVLIEQSPSFMRTVGAANWFHHTLLWAEETGRRVVTRKWSADKLAQQRSLQHDLVGAWGLLAHSSAAAVTAMLEGIRVTVDPMSAVAHVVMSTDNSADGRRHALNVLADNQFTLNEMKEGMAWAKVGS